MTDLLLKGSKGGGSGSGSFKQTPDTLRSDDTFEGVLGLAIGPLKGPKRGLKSIKVDGTAIENESGEKNLGDFLAIVGDGDPAKYPQKIALKLGAGAAPTAVNLAIPNTNPSSPGPWVTKTLTNTGANFIDLRFVVQSLYKQTDKGIYEDALTLDIEMKPTGSATWIDPTAAMPGTTYNEGGIPYNYDYGDGISVLDIYIPASLFNPDGSWSSTGQTGGGYSGSGTGFPIRGKTTQQTVYEVRIAVPNTGDYEGVQWDIRVRLREKAEIDNENDVRRRIIAWESIAAVYSAILGEHVDWQGVAWMHLFGKASEQLTGVPEITGEWDTKIVSVPPIGVYNPDTRQYTGAMWDGSWAKAFTTDPAWIINDAISDSLSGISLIAEGSYLNKWDALEASKWCSELVPDGKGGTHPRYSLNLVITDAMKAEEFVRFLAGACGGLAWDQGDGEWRLKMDKPETPVDIFTLETIEGEFVYSHTDVDTRYNDITMAFKNAEMDYREDRVRLYDNAHIAQYGRKPTTLVGVGCTDRQEAMRRTKLRLESTTGETRMVNFTTNRRGRNVNQLDMILIADGDLGDREQRSTGRTIAVSGDRKTITLRDTVRLEVGVAYTLHFSSPNPNYDPETSDQPAADTWRLPTVAQTRNITNTSGERGNVTTLKLDTALPADIPDNLSISLSATGLPTLPKLYRVLNVIPDDGNPERIGISALEVNVDKWDAADNVTNEDTIFQDLRGPTPTPLLPPEGTMLKLVRVPTAGGGDVVNLMGTFTRPPSSFISGFRIEYSVNGGNTILLAERTQSPTFEIVNPAPGTYKVSVRAIDRRGQVSEALTETKEVTQAMIDAAVVIYGDGTPVEDLQPAEPGATEGAPIGTEVGGVPVVDLLDQVNDSTAAYVAQQLQINDIIIDVSDLVDVFGTTETAEFYADAAELARDAAQAARDQSQAARDASQAARDVAIAQAGAASGSASAASGHASAALDYRDEAEGFASSAEADAIVAGTERGLAVAAKDAAAISEDNAEGAAASAITQASLSASANVASRNAASLVFPGDMTFGERFFAETIYGNPATVPELPSSVASFVTDAYGRWLRITPAAGGAYYHFRTRALIPATPGRRWRISVTYRQVTSPAAGDTALVVAAYGVPGTFDTLSYSPFEDVTHGPSINGDAVAGNSGTLWMEGTVPASPTHPWIAPSFYSYNAAGPGGITDVLRYEVVDVTEARESEGWAEAANLSSSTASAFADDAGEYASAANDQRILAETARGLAQASQTAAALSESNASGHASTASTQATLSAQARDAALSTAVGQGIRHFRNGSGWTTSTQLGPTAPDFVPTAPDTFFNDSDGQGFSAYNSGWGYTGKYVFKAIEGRTYRVNVVARSASVAGGTVFVYFMGTNGSMVYNGWAALIGGSQTAPTTFTELHFDFQATAAMAANPYVGIQFGANPASGGHVRFREVWVEDISERVETTAQAGIATAAVATASGHAATATTQATLAATANTAATKAALRALPSTFEESGRYFTHDYGANILSSSPVSLSADGQFSFPAETGVGTVLRHENASIYAYIRSKAYMRIQPGRTYRVSTRARCISGPNTSLYIGPFIFNAVGDYVTLPTANYVDVTNAGVWTDVEKIVTGDSLIASGGSYMAAGALMGYPNNGSITQWQFLRMEDITESVTAQTQASVATSAAATATDKAAAASTSATLAATINMGTMNPNPVFSLWTNSGSIPDLWTLYTSTGGGSISRVAGDHGGYALQLNKISGTVWEMYWQVPDVAPRGYYVMELDVDHVSGNWNGIGMRVYSYDSSWGYIANYGIFPFADIPIGETSAPGVTPTSRRYRYRKMFQITSTSARNMYVGVGVGTDSGSTATGSAIIRRAGVRPASDQEIAAKVAIPTLEASVASNSAAIVTLEGRALAYWQQVVNAGIGNGATAFVELRAESSWGAGAVSTIAMGARELWLYNQVGSTFVKSMSVVSGNVTIYGDLNALGAMRFGTRRIPVALQSFGFTASDGDSVSFGGDLVNMPSVEFDTSNLPVLTGGNAYDIRANSLTPTGFTMYAKIITPGSPSTVTQGPGTNTGGTPSHRLHKSDAADSLSGYYTFKASVQVRVSAPAGELQEGFGYLDCYVRPNGGSWTYIGTISVYASGGFGGGSAWVTVTAEEAKYYANTIGQDAGGDHEFGIIAGDSNLTINSFTSVVYQKQSTSGGTTAVPQAIKVRVIPQNA